MLLLMYLLSFGIVTCEEISVEILKDLTNMFYNLPVAFQNCNNTEVLRSNLTYTLYTQQNPENGTILTDSNLNQSINGNNRVIVIIHGWLQDAKGDFTQMKNAYLQKGPANIILLDWSSYSMTVNYGAAFCAVPLIGEYTGNIIIDLGIDLNAITINGFSLGAQIAGFAGQQVQNRTGGLKIARINGLDAAGPGFLGLPLNQRVDATDALFVQGIHTSNYQFGYTELYATADFQVNCGAVQPGCPLTPNSVSDNNSLDFISILTRIFCNHLRAVSYFIESIITGNFIGVKCKNCTLFISNQCKLQPGTLMGEECPSTAKGEYFLSTNSVSKFARGNAGKGTI